MFNRLPPELRVVILGNCDFQSLLHLRQVCTYTRLLAEEELLIRKHLDVTSDYVDVFSDCNSNLHTHSAILLDKLIDFIRVYMPHLNELSLRYCPAVLTLTSLIQLAAVTPEVTALDLSQMCDKPRFEKDAVHALPYFRKLKTLKLDGFTARRSSGRGCAHRIEVPPIRQMRDLEVLEISSPQDTLSRIIFSMRESQVILRNLKRVNFGVKHCSAVYPELLIWFLRAHRSLVSVHIQNALFATLDQLRRFYNAVMLLPFLVELRLDGCSLCDRMDPTMQLQFAKALTSKGIIQEGSVRSMRYDPDNDL